MKVRLSIPILRDMPDAVRTRVIEWKARYKKAFIHVETVPKFYPGEDDRVTLINLSTGAEGSAQVAGEFAGLTALSPTAEIPLPVGVVAVVTGFFCGEPHLTVYQGSAPQLAEVAQ